VRVSFSYQRIGGPGNSAVPGLQFSRHKDLKTLQVYIDEVEDAQGKIAELVAD